MLLLLGLVLSSRFHLLCIIVPYDLTLDFYDYNLFYDEYQTLTKGEKQLLSKSGITEGQIINLMSMGIRLVSKRFIFIYLFCWFRTAETRFNGLTLHLCSSTYGQLKQTHL